MPRARPVAPHGKRPRHRARRLVAAGAGLALALGLATVAEGSAPRGPVGPVGPAARGAGPGDDAPMRSTPAPGADVVALFRRPAELWSAGHRGVDLTAGAGAEVVAPADGVVAFAGVVVDRGVLTLAHGGGLRSSLEPVTDTLPVGTAVSAGDVVARVAVGPSHCAATCLHWGVRAGEEYVDPLALLPGAGPVVLLPPG